MARSFPLDPPVPFPRWLAAGRLAGRLSGVRWRADLVGPVLLAALTVGWLAWMGSLVLVRHGRFGSYGCDLGIYDQALWLISQGEVPFITVRGLHAFGDHFSPVLYLLALLYRVGMGVEALLWTQTVALALGAWPLYRIGARQSGSPWVGLLCAGTYLLYPPLRAINLFDFHPISLAVPGLLFALAFAFERRAVPMLLACCWSVLCKQEVAVVVACIAIWYAVRWRQPKALALTAFGLLWFVVATRVMAHYAGTSESAYIELYSQYGNTTGEVLRTFLFTPWIPLARLGRYESWSYLLLLLMPLALLPLRSPGILWLLAFPLALNLFSNRGFMRDPNYWYQALLAPVLCAAAAVAVARMPAGRLRALTAFAWLGCAVLGARALRLTEEYKTRRPALSAVEAAATGAVLESVPAGASVSATQSLLPHLSHRKEIGAFPNPFVRIAVGPTRLALRQQACKDPAGSDRAALRRGMAAGSTEYVLLGYRAAAAHSAWPLNPWDFPVMFAEALRSPAYGVVRHEAGVIVLRRGADHRAGLRRLGLASQEGISGFVAGVAPAPSIPRESIE